ncbi:MAG: lipid II flippase MurJ [Bacillota bacterium]|nr:lipid II flippase MurJ [Bacillota bacterium]
MQTTLQQIWLRIKDKPILLVLLMNVLLAGSGFLKDVLFAHYLGTTETADAFTFAYFIADTIGNNLIATALGVVSIPIFTALVLKGNTKLLKRVTALLSSSVFVSTVVLSLCFYFAGKLAEGWMSDSSWSTKYQLAFHYFVLMLPIIVLFPLALIGSSLLQAQYRFLVPSVGPVLFNAVFIIGTALCILFRIGDEWGGTLLSGSITLAAVVYVLYIWQSARMKESKSIVEIMQEKKRVRVYTNAIIAHFFPYFLLLSFTQVLLFVERFLAFHLPEGTLASLNYAYRLAQMPIWVFVSAVTTVILPEFSAAITSKTFISTIKKMKSSLVITILLSLAMSLLLFVLREPVIALLFKRGAFTEKSVQITSTILAGYSLSIPGTSLSLIGIRYYVAKRALSLPLLFLFVTTVISIAFDFLFVPKWGAAAIGYGAALGSAINGLLFIAAIRMEWKKIAWKELSV